MGLSSSSSKTNSTSTTMPKVPSWIQGPTQDILGQVAGLAGQAPHATPISSLQNQAFAGGANLNLTDPTAGAQDATRSLLDFQPGSVTAGQLSGTDLSAYTNPWDSSVLNASLADIERFRNMGINSNSSAATMAGGVGAWGGSRAGVADSQTNDAALRTAASTAAQLRSQGFLNAQDRALSDIGNRLNADQFNTNTGLAGAGLRLNAAGQLGNQQLAGQQNIRSNLGLMGDLGTAQHTAEQEQNPQNVQMTYLSNLLRLIQGANPGLYTGSRTDANSKTTSSPSLLDSIGSIVQTLGAMGGIPGMPKI